MKEYNILLIALKTNYQQYFDFHHAGNDALDKINPREQELGGVAMAAMAYVVNKLFN
ncbi:MAG: hypothetical protein M0R21_04600 [Lentimicrobiaceae bacterium]|nr:hypothetical protein [Lentimicrobiaceae bacterium]